MSDRSTSEKYLERHGAVEAGLAAALGGTYSAALVVPVHRESPELLARLLSSVDRAGRHVLVVLVVNAAADRAEATWPLHRELLEGLTEGFRPLAEGAWLGRRRGSSLLVIDRARPDRSLPRGQGVGLARKIGCDLALAAARRGLLESEWLFCTDADAELSEDYFEPQGAPGDSALVYPFEHVPGLEGSAVDQATWIYEVRLRYYVLGLRHANSPYAYGSIGSCLAVHRAAYAQVRGFPKRLGGEDFHILSKLAKVGTIHRAPRGRVRLLSRTSDRTVLGTGVATRRITEGAEEQALLYDPESFEHLRRWLGVLDAFACDPKVDRARTLAARLSPAGELVGAADRLGAWDALARAARGCRGAIVLHRRLHEWFDALKTLRFLHALRDAGHPSAPWRISLARCRWLADASSLCHQPPAAIAVALAAREAGGPCRLGISALGAPLERRGPD